MVEENATNIPKAMKEPPQESVETGVKATKTAKPLADRTNKPNDGVRDKSGKARKRKEPWQYKEKKGNRNRNMHKKQKV
jgi:hypothetical protein